MIFHAGNSERFRSGYQHNSWWVSWTGVFHKGLFCYFYQFHFSSSIKLTFMYQSEVLLYLAMLIMHRLKFETLLIGYCRNTWCDLVYWRLKYLFWSLEIENKCCQYYVEQGLTEEPLLVFSSIFRFPFPVFTIVEVIVLHF